MATTYPSTPRRQGDDNAPHVSPVTPEEDARTVFLNEISWGAVLAGVVVALVTQLLLNMLGISIGLASFNPQTGDNPDPTTFSIAAGIWWTISGIIASFAGGVAAGRLAGRPKESTAGWHGLIAWALTTLLIVYVLTAAAGTVIGGAYNVVSNALGGLGRTVTTAAQTAAPGLGQVQDPFASIEQAIRQNTGGSDPAALRDAAIAAVRAAVTGDPAQAQAARERAAELLARAQNISPEEARTRLTQYEQQYRQSLEQARRQAAELQNRCQRRFARRVVRLLCTRARRHRGLVWWPGRGGRSDGHATIHRACSARLST